MQFSNLLAFLALSAAALAIPTVDVAKSAPLEKRNTVGVFLCTDAGFTGRCVHISSTPGECVELSSDLNDLVTAVGPDQDAGDCRFFFDFGCVDNNGFQHFDTGFPGISNLAVSNPGANDQISSYFCSG